MLINFWMANASGEMEKAVNQFLPRVKAFDVKEKTGEEFPEVTWTQFVDDDEDTINVLRSCLWYNDRSEEDIEKIASEMKKLLVRYGSMRRR